MYMYYLEGSKKKKMTNKCVYCNSEVPESRVMQICDLCGKNVWGERMFSAILKNTEEAKEQGNLEFNSNF